MTVRLSHSSLTGTERTEVAVGTVSEASMLADRARRGAAQHGELRLVARGRALGGRRVLGDRLGGALGRLGGLRLGAAAWPPARGPASGVGSSAFGVAPGLGPGLGLGLDLGLARRRAGRLGGPGRLRGDPLATGGAPLVGPFPEKYAAHVGSTELGSC